MTWTVTAYDSSDNLLESITLPILKENNNGEYYGIAKNGISYAVALIDSGYSSGHDWIFIDNFSFKTISGGPVPEPSTMLLLGSGLLGLAGYGRKRLSKRS